MFIEPNIGMAMRRLSIIDVACGHQPMSNEEGTVHIVYNGETYNHRDLQAELEVKSHEKATRLFRNSALLGSILDHHPGTHSIGSGLAGPLVRY